MAEKVITKQELAKMVQEGKLVVCLFGAVYDLTAYAEQHPGGK